MDQARTDGVTDNFWNDSRAIITEVDCGCVCCLSWWSGRLLRACPFDLIEGVIELINGVVTICMAFRYSHSGGLRLYRRLDLRYFLTTGISLEWVHPWKYRYTVMEKSILRDLRGETSLGCPELSTQHPKSLEFTNVNRNNFDV